MRSLMIKSKPDGVVCPGHPTARPGAAPGVIHHRIDNIPDEVEDAEVVRIFGSTADLTWLAGGARYVFDFAELGVGVAIRS